MKIAFIIYDVTYAEPFGLMHLSTIAKKRNCITKLFSVVGSRYQDIIDFKPDIIAYSAMSSQIKEVLYHNRAIRSSLNSVTIIGGAHPTYFQKIAEENFVDAICVGEGEIAFGDFIDRYHDRNAWEFINNITTTNRIPQLNPLITDYEAIGFADRDLVYVDQRLARQKMKSFYASRGCPFACTYCFNHAFNKTYRGKGPIVRRRTVDHLIEELCMVRVNYGFEFVRFGDDCFSFRADEWLEEFAIKYKNKVGIPFWVQLRPGIVSEDILKLLKSAGCTTVGTSIEHGNESIRQDLLKRQTEETTKVENAYKLLNKYGLKVYANCMFGLPYTTVDDDIRSIKFMIDNKIDVCAATVFTPFPGTSLYDTCVSNGMMEPYDIDNIPETTFGVSVLNCFTESEKHIQSNLAQLTPLIGIFPSFYRQIVMLTRIRSHSLINLIHFIARHYAYSRIIPIKLGLKDIVNFVKTSKNLYFKGKQKRADL